MLKLVSDLNKWWETYGQAQAAEAARLLQQALDRDQEIKALQDLSAGYNPIKALVNAWRRSTEIPEIQSDLGGLLSSYWDKRRFLREKSDEDASVVLAEACKDRPSLARPLFDTQERLRILQADSADLKEISEATDNVLALIIKARTEVKIETIEGVNQLKYLQKKIRSYGLFMESKYEVFRSTHMSAFNTNSSNKVADWTLFFELAEINFVGMIANRENREQPEVFKKTLDVLKEKITPIQTEIDKQIITVDRKRESLEDVLHRVKITISNDYGLHPLAINFLTRDKDDVAIENPLPERKVKGFEPL